MDFDSNRVDAKLWLCVLFSFCHCDSVGAGTEAKGKRMYECFVSDCLLGIMGAGLMQINYSVITSVVVVGSADDGVVVPLFSLWAGFLVVFGSLMECFRVIASNEWLRRVIGGFMWELFLCNMYF